MINCDSQIELIQQYERTFCLIFMLQYVRALCVSFTLR